MNLSLRFSVLSVFACAATTVAHAGMVTIHFDELGINGGSDFADFDVVAGQYSGLAGYGGLTFSGERYASNSGPAIDTTFGGLRIYDTGNGAPSPDPDLEKPYDAVNVPWLTDAEKAAFDPGKILIVPTDESAPADDEANGGRFILTWSQPVIVNRMVLIDFEAGTDEIYTLTFDGANAFTSSGLGTRLGDDKVHGISETDFGTHTINQLILDSHASGAIGSISFTVVPEPSSLLFFGTFGAIAALFLRRRR